MILTDTFIVENAQLIQESRNGSSVTKLRGTFGRCDEKNKCSLQHTQQTPQAKTQ